MVKTEKTTAERELEQNLSFEWDRVEERGQQLQPVFGPGLTGLRNLGNSCYLASVMQVLFATVPFASAYYSSSPLKETFFRSPPQPTADFHTQLVKLGHGLLSGKYSKPAAASKESEAEQPGIPPRMFKSVIGRSHPEFSTSRQQDAFEYFQYLFELLQQQPQGGGAGQAGGEGEPGQRPSRQFEFRVEERIQCAASGQVSLKQREDNALSLPIPLEAAVPAPGGPSDSSGGTSQAQEAGEHRTGAEDACTPGQAVRRPRVPLMACLQAFARADEIPSFFSSAINGVTTAQRTVRFLTFPNYLTLHMRKYVVDTTSWTPRKLDIELEVPHTIDISFLRAPNGGGLQPGEVALPDSDAGMSVRGTQAAPAAPVPKPEIVSALEGMGFPRELCKKGAVATGNAGVEEAATWILTDGAAAQDGPPASSAPVPGASPAVADADVATLMAFGFPEIAARNALAHCGPDVERAADWILNNPEAAEAPLAAAPAPDGTQSAPPNDSTGNSAPPDGHGKYELFAFISHLGANTQCGHYVCHVKKEGRWVLFNDQKVALSEDPPFEFGYLYFFERTSV